MNGVANHKGADNTDAADGVYAALTADAADGVYAAVAADAAQDVVCVKLESKEASYAERS